MPESKRDPWKSVPRAGLPVPPASRSSPQRFQGLWPRADPKWFPSISAYFPQNCQSWLACRHRSCQPPRTLALPHCLGPGLSAPPGCLTHSLGEPTCRHPDKLSPSAAVSLPSPIISTAPSWQCYNSDGTLNLKGKLRLFRTQLARFP